MVCTTINDVQYRFAEGSSVLECLRQVDIEVPTLCHDDRLQPFGGCRLCVVEVEGSPEPVAACTERIREGMVVKTHTPALENSRRANLLLLAARYPAEHVDRHPEKAFHRYLARYGVTAACSLQPETAAIDRSHPHITVDMSRCIHCLRCVRICDEVQGQFVWQALNRGNRTVIAPESETTLLESSCVSCGACVDSCPTGALEDSSILSLGAPQSWTKTTCPYCGTGCEMYVGTRNDRIVTVRPAMESPVNKGHLCVKGRYAFAFNHAPDRITTPMIRVDGAWQQCSWDDAYRHIGYELERLTATHGADSIGVLGSSRATNEENYLAQKFARVVLGTNNVDCCARVCHAPSAVGLKSLLGTGAATNSYDDIEAARTILVAGANPTSNHPVVGARIKQAKRRGAKLIVIDPRKTELAALADHHLQLSPGTNIALLNAMAFTIVEEGLCDEGFLADRVDGAESFSRFIRDYPPESASEACGVDAGEIRAAARLYAGTKPSMCIHGLGMTEHVQGSDSVMSLINLALLTGNVGRPGTGVNPLRGQNNVQGAAHMGCEPAHLTGYVPLQTARPQFAEAWNRELPTRQGLNLMQMIDAANLGRLKALWVIGYDLYFTNPHAGSSLREGLAATELVIVQDLFMTETAREFGTVFLPAASPFEKDGTYMNGERRVGRVRQVLEPQGEALPDWQIICGLARQLGFGAQFAYSSAEEIWNEVRSLWAAGRGITYERLEAGGVQWPCPDEDHPGTTVLHQAEFPHGRRAALEEVLYLPTKEAVSEEYPFLLTTGRTLYHYNAGTMTLRSGNKKLHAADVLHISSSDAFGQGLEDGQTVRLVSRYGDIEVQLKFSDAVRPGQLFTTFHHPQVFVNRLTGPYRDGPTATPEYKVTTVRIEPKAV